MRRLTTMMLAGLAGLAIALPAAAQMLDKTQEKALETAAIDSAISSAFALCARLLGGDEAELDTLENRGWSVDRYYQTDVDPFFLEAAAWTDISGLGAVDVYVGAELYPAADIVYCTYTVDGPARTIALDGLAEVFPGADVVVNEGGAYAVFEIEAASRLYTRIKSVDDTFLLQVTLVDVFDD